jgi:NCS1 family nucleobase:cation symporter-1
VLVIALSIPSQYLDSFNTFVLLMLYFLVPWTAVNLVDFYLVRHGHYAVTEIYNPDGIYGRWGWRGMIAYIVGFAAMVPFFVTSFYTGPIASMLVGRIYRLRSASLYLDYCTSRSPEVLI